MLVGIAVVILHVVGVVVGGQKRFYRPLLTAHQKRSEPKPVPQLLLENLVGVTTHPLVPTLVLVGMRLLRMKLPILLLRPRLPVRLAFLLGWGQSAQLKSPPEGKAVRVRAEIPHRDKRA